MKVGAPLPEKLGALPVGPTLLEIEQEMERCEVELMYAVARHRQAWAAMRKWANHRAEAADNPGMLAAIDSDPIWKKRTGDVSWWRGEMDCQSNALLALDVMRRFRMEANDGTA